MTRQGERMVRCTGRSSATARAVELAAILAGCMNIGWTSVALADRDTPQFQRGACQGAYPGWLRGVVDGYHGLSTSPVADPSSVLKRVPTPETLHPGEERLGFGDGLMFGFKAGVAYGSELGRAARTPDSDDAKMLQSSAQLQAYMQTHCGDLVTALDWDTTAMNETGTSTIASLNEAQAAMHLAVSANQEAVVAERLARGAREADQKGDRAGASKFRESAEFAARMFEDFAAATRSQAALGREEAVQAITDAEQAAERAKKAAASAREQP